MKSDRLQTFFCQAQPKPQLQLSWAEIALISSNTPTTRHPPGIVGKWKGFGISVDISRFLHLNYFTRHYFTEITSLKLLHY